MKQYRVIAEDGFGCFEFVLEAEDEQIVRRVLQDCGATVIDIVELNGEE